MNLHSDIYQKCKELWTFTPNRETAKGDSTFIFCEVINQDDGNMATQVMIIDPDLLDTNGVDAEGYMACSPRTRAVLEVIQILPVLLQAACAVSTYAPFDEEMMKEAEGNKTRMANLLRKYSLKGMAMRLIEYGKEQFP